VTSPSSTSADTGAGPEELTVACRAATADEDVAIHHAIRHAVFVQEQGFFDGNDRDARDDDPSTVKVLSFCGPVAGGAVRLYPLDEPGLWKGDRLAVLAAFRPRGLGAHLVRFAVRTAGQRGGELVKSPTSSHAAWPSSASSAGTRRARGVRRPHPSAGGHPPVAPRCRGDRHRSVPRLAGFVPAARRTAARRSHR
jgi:GNAT superfamily N-acetyltransferase